jgi:FkbM family methyltransferase
MVCARSVGTEVCIVAVEPQPTCLRRSHDNFELNSFPGNIKLVGAALGETPALLPMAEAPPQNTAWASFVLRDAGRRPYYVNVATVPEILARLGIAALDLMLLDVEGLS